MDEVTKKLLQKKDLQINLTLRGKNFRAFVADSQQQEVEEKMESQDFIDILKGIDETRPVATYVELLRWAAEESIKKEDLATACKIFLINYEASSERRAYGLPSSALLDSDYFG